MIAGGKDAADLERAVEGGFECAELAFDNLTPEELAHIENETAPVREKLPCGISCLGAYNNPLANEHHRQVWEMLIDAAPRFGTDLVCGFTGRLEGEISDSICAFKSVFGELAKRAEDKGVRLAFENCQLRGNWWFMHPVPTQAGRANIAIGPKAWEMMFDAVDSPVLGLEWEPTHSMMFLMEPIGQLHEWMPKIFHVHGKDGQMHWDVIRKHGIGGPLAWYGEECYAHHRFPGLGDNDWKKILKILLENDYDGTVDIEGWHDPVFCGGKEWEGRANAFAYMKECREAVMPTKA